MPPETPSRTRAMPELCLRRACALAGAYDYFA